MSPLRTAIHRAAACALAALPALAQFNLGVLYDSGLEPARALLKQSGLER